MECRARILRLWATSSHRDAPCGEREPTWIAVECRARTRDILVAHRDSISRVTSRVLFNTRLRHGLRRASRVRFRKDALGNCRTELGAPPAARARGAPRVTSVTASRLLRDATSGNSRYRRIFRDSEARCILIGTKSPHGRAFGAPTANALERLRSGMHAVPVRRSPESSLCRPHL